MKFPSNKAALVVASIVIAVAIVAALSALSGAGNGTPAVVRAQALPSPSPTPVDQKWKVEYGSIEELEIKLHEMNKLSQEVYLNNIKVSSDGKRFVILWYGEGGSDEQNEEGR